VRAAGGRATVAWRPKLRLKSIATRAGGAIATITSTVAATRRASAGIGRRPTTPSSAVRLAAARRLANGNSGIR